MRSMLVSILLILCAIPLFMALPHRPVHAGSTESINPLVTGSVNRNTAEETRDLATILDHIEPISRETQVSRSIAHATFCLPQNVLGTLYYGLLQLTGSVVTTADMNEVTIIVTRTPFMVSLGKYIFVSRALLTENVVRHEYGHTMQGYTHGPFYLLFEGLTSFVQAVVSLCRPSFAKGYFDRWPENEADELGGVTR